MVPARLSLRTKRSPVLPEPHNLGTGWQGRFRVGLFDAVAARYALAAAGPVDGLAMTHIDRLPGLGCRMCRAYRDDGPIDGGPDHIIRDGAGRIIDLPVPRRPISPDRSALHGC